MAPISDTDLVAAMAIAATLIIIALVVWPGAMRVRPRALAGYWASQTTGAIYELRPGLGRQFTLISRGSAAPGVVRGLRGVRLDAQGLAPGDRVGRVELSGRRIAWKDGDEWSLQGIR